MSFPSRGGPRRVRDVARDLFWRRQSDTARLYQDAFLYDLYAHWQPRSPREIWYDRASRLTHLGTRLFSGGPTLAPIAVAAVPTLIGNVFFVAEAGSVPASANLSPGSPVGVFLVLAVGLVGLIAEVVRSPREIQLRRFSVIAAVPLGLGLLLDTFQASGGKADIGVLRVGLACTGLALIAVPMAGLSRGGTQLAVLRLLRAAAIGCLIIAVIQAYWVVRYTQAGYPLVAAGQAFVTVGALLFVAAFARARPLVPHRGLRTESSAAEVPRQGS